MAILRNIEWTAEQGYMVGMFDINQPEILTTSEERGAYMKALANKMAGCFDGMSKTLAMYLYGGKYGVIDKQGNFILEPVYDSIK